MTSILEPTRELQPAHKFYAPLTRCEWRDSGNPDTPYETTLRGHAAVFNSLSHDLGGFKEILAPGAFRAALRKNPDVRLLFNHDANHVLARTASGTLELREDASGLHMFARVDRRISWVDDLRTSMQRGDIDQASFAFDLLDQGDDWTVTDEGTVIRSIQPDGVANLYDVSIVTYPAYESTRVSMRGVLEAAIAAGRLPGSPLDIVGAPEAIAPNEVGGDAIAARGGDQASQQGARHKARVAAIRLRQRQTPTPKETP